MSHVLEQETHTTRHLQSTPAEGSNTAEIEPKCAVDKDRGNARRLCGSMQHTEVCAMLEDIVGQNMGVAPLYLVMLSSSQAP